MSLRPDAARGAHGYSDVVHVFEPNALTLPSLPQYCSELFERRAFIKELAGAEVRGQRSTTFLGELWSLVDPLFQGIVYWFMFVVIRGGNGGARATEYVTAIIGSVFLYNFTRISVAEGGRSILRHKGLVLNAVFPRALLPIAEVYKGFLSTLPALALYAVLHLMVRAPLSSGLLMLPLLFAIQATINLGLALLFSTATAYSKDVSNLLNYVLRVLPIATPIMYPVSTLTPGLKQLLSFNPLFALFSSFQAIITGQTPAAGLVLQSMGWAVAVFLLGAWVFVRHERSFGLHV